MDKMVRKVVTQIVKNNFLERMLIEEVVINIEVKEKMERRVLIGERSNAIIVRNMGIIHMNVGTTIRKKDGEAHLVQDEDGSNSDQVLLMVTTSSSQESSSWYLDTNCSNHMTGSREWLIDLNPHVKNSVRFVDNSTILVEKIGKLMIIENMEEQLI